MPGSLPSGLPAGLAIPDESSVHLGVSLRLANEADLDAFLAAQQDPSSPEYHHWLTPEEFGERFGQPAEVYEQAARWLESGGVTVKRFPNRLFLEAQGSAAQAGSLLSLHLQAVDTRGPAVHVPDRLPTLPAALSDLVLHIAGLDTRSHFKHRLAGSQGNSFGPQDLRRVYNVQPLLEAGYVGQGQKLVVLGEAESAGNAPSPVAIDYFLQNVSDAKTPFQQDILSNPQNDFDQTGGGGVEFSLDVEMQSVGAPGADSITLVVPPASEIFTTGVNYIVNEIPGATAVSLSVGGCEPGIQQDEPGVPASFEALLKQGVAEGQTWSAATGDQGADACQNGTTVAVDFPASIPEMVAMGGTQLTSPNWDDSRQRADGLSAGDGLEWGTRWGSRRRWHEQVLFPVPSYQSGLFEGAGRGACPTSLPPDLRSSGRAVRRPVARRARPGSRGRRSLPRSRPASSR